MTTAIELVRQPIRRLGFGELRMHLMQTMLAGTTQGALSVRVAGPVSMAALHAAVAQVRRAHRMLGLAIEERDGEFHFVEQPHETAALVELRPVAARIGDGMRELQAENAILLDPARHTWRIAVVPYQGEEQVHDIILVMHHAIMDAGGSDHLLHQVFSLMAGAPPAAGAPEPVPPSAESACLVATSWEQFTATQQALTQRTRAVHPPAHRHAAPHAARRTVGQTLKLGSAEAAALEARCAASGVSLNSYISAALMTAVGDCDPERKDIALYTAVSLRRLCPAVADSKFGCYLSVVPTFHQARTPEADIAALAREHQAALQAAFLDYGKPPRDYSTTAVLAGMQGLARIDNFVNDIAFTFAESQLHARYGELRLLQSHVLSNRAAGNVALVLHGLKLNQEVFFTLIHTEPLQDPAWARRVCARLGHLLGATHAAVPAASS
jgi:hypothetical protein